ncbi:MAG: hypothetical protein R2932_16185 [Caldilineaceae bacterium]
MVVDFINAILAINTEAALAVIGLSNIEIPTLWLHCSPGIEL